MIAWFLSLRRCDAWQGGNGHMVVSPTTGRRLGQIAQGFSSGLCPSPWPACKLLHGFFCQRRHGSMAPFPSCMSACDKPLAPQGQSFL